MTTLTPPSRPHRFARRWAAKAAVKVGAIAMAMSLLAACASGNGSGSTTSQPSQTSTRARVSMPTPTETFNDATSPDRQHLADPGVSPAGFVDPPEGQGIQRYLDQEITWQPCQDTDDDSETDDDDTETTTECATVSAPLDWTDPDGQAITLAMKRTPATDDTVVGDLFINPGGPGASAQDFVDYFDNTGLEGYNIIGLDPRGSGESTPVVCGDLAQTDAFFETNWAPETRSQRNDLIEAAQDFAAQCWNNSGVLLDHISSIDNAYDMDMVRQLLGDDQLNWFGVSYGTWLGAVYAELYPDKVGRMVLDSPVNITDDESVTQADGFEASLNDYAQWCAEESCGLGSTSDEVIARIQGFLDGLAQNPMTIGDRTMTATMAAEGIALYMYSGASEYRWLTAILTWSLDYNSGQALLAASDGLNGRSDDGYDQLVYSFPAIGCKDTADIGVDALFDEWQNEDSVEAPIFGKYFGPNINCAVWASEPDAQIRITAADAPTILVVSNDGDSATPHVYSEWMHDQMPTTVLVTREATGHGAYGGASGCLNNAVVDYLVADEVPQDGLVCTDH